MIYLIEKAWSDSLENECNAAFGYSVIGYMTNEDEARKYCESQGLLKKGFSWAAPANAPVCRYKAVNKI